MQQKDYDSIKAMASVKLRPVAAITLHSGRGSFDEGRLPDDAFVVRGGTNTAERFSKASGARTESDGTVSSVSVNCAAGKSISDLSKTIPNSQIGVTTVGKVREMGGDVAPKPRPSNPDHCELHGLTPMQAQTLFTPTQPNRIAES
jgi:hypothetical protein